MVELVMVMILVGVLAVFVLPRMQAGISLQDDAWRDQIVSALRYAQKSAVSHRRLVCVTVGSADVALAIASVNPAVACDAPLIGPDGSGTYAISAGANADTTVSPAGLIYFQPDGRATSTGAGTSASTRTISMNGASNVMLYGETGFAE